MVCRRERPLEALRPRLGSLLDVKGLHVSVSNRNSYGLPHFPNCGCGEPVPCPSISKELGSNRFLGSRLWRPSVFVFVSVCVIVCLCLCFMCMLERCSCVISKQVEICECPGVCAWVNISMSVGVCFHLCLMMSAYCACTFMGVQTACFPQETFGGIKVWQSV